MTTQSFSPELPPELWIEIGYLASRSSQAALCRTSRTLNHLITPILYCLVEIVADSKNGFETLRNAMKNIAGHSSRENDALRMKGEFVERLDITVNVEELFVTTGAYSVFNGLVGDLVEIALSKMTGLQHFGYHSELLNVTTGMNNVLTKLTNLHSLNLTLPAKVQFGPKALIGFPNLKEATISNFGSHSVDMLLQFRLTAPQMEKLTLLCEDWDEAESDEVEETTLWGSIFPDHKTHGIKPIRELFLKRIPMPSIRLDENLRPEAYVEGLQNLRSLRLEETWTTLWNNGVHFFDEFWKELLGLEEIAVIDPPDLCGQCLKRFLRKSPPNLRSLTFVIDKFKLEKLILSVAAAGANLAMLLLERAPGMEFRAPRSCLTMENARDLAIACPNLRQLSLDDLILYSEFCEVANVLAEYLPRLEALKICSAVASKEILHNGHTALFHTPPTTNSLPYNATSPLILYSTFDNIESSTSRILYDFANHDNYNLRYVGWDAVVYEVNVKKNEIVGISNPNLRRSGMRVIPQGDLPYIFRAYNLSRREPPSFESHFEGQTE